MFIKFEEEETLDTNITISQLFRWDFNFLPLSYNDENSPSCLQQIDNIIWIISLRLQLWEFTTMLNIIWIYTSKRGLPADRKVCACVWSNDETL